MIDNNQNNNLENNDTVENIENNNPREPVNINNTDNSPDVIPTENVNSNNTGLNSNDILNSAPVPPFNSSGQIPAAPPQSFNSIGQENNGPVPPFNSPVPGKNDIFNQINNQNDIYSTGNQAPPFNDETELSYDDTPDEGMDLEERLSRKRKRKVQARFSGCLKTLLYSLVIFSVSLVLGFFILSSAFDFIGVARPNEESSVEFTINEGDSIEDIAANLKAQDIITQPKVFELFVRFAKSDTVFTPGTYTVKTNADYNSLVHQLQYVSSSTDTVKLTFPEGYTLDEIVEKLDENGVCDKAELLSYIQTADLSGYDIISLTDEDKRYRRLEGYFFPDTYEFYKGEPVKNVTEKFLTNLEERLTSNIRDASSEIGMTVDEVLTLASIVQKEAAEFDDMQNVAAVFHNRLNSTDLRKLQSDTTSNYPSSNYDTYEIEGLPPGPICSPGMDAIEAVLTPTEDSDYYYFASDKNGKFYYAETYDEHEVNTEAIARVNGE